MKLLKSLFHRNKRSGDTFEGSDAMSAYSAVLSISVLVVSTSLILGNLLHRLAFRIDNDKAIYDKYAQVNLFSFQFKLEMVDKAVWMICLMIGLVVLIIGSSQKHHFWLSRLLSNKVLLCGVLVMSVSVLTVSPLFDNLVDVYWFGFGDKVFLASLIAMPIAYWLNLKDLKSNWVILTRYFLVAFFIFNYLPSLLQPLWAIKDPVHSAYVINEVLAPNNGQIPAVNFAAQYTNLSGFLFELINRVIPYNSQLFMLHAASVYLTLLTLLTFCILFVITGKITSGSVSSVIPIIVLTFMLVTPNSVGSGLITSLFSAVSIRILPVYLVCLLLIRDHFSRRHVFLLGVVASLAAINNLDFGIPVFFATVIVMFIHPTILIYRRLNLTSFCLGISFSLIAYLGLLSALSGSFKLNLWLLFASSFGSGFGSVPMPIGGIHVFILGLFCASIAIGAMNTKYLIVHTNNSERRAAVVSLFFGLVGLGAFPYFVNRSVVSGQLQTFLFLAGPLLCATFSIVRIDFRIFRRPSYLLASALILFPQSLIIGSYMQRPDGRVEWKRVLNFESNPYAERTNLIRSAVSLAETTLDRDIKFGLISQGNLYLPGLNIRNVSLIDDPTDAWSIGGGLRGQICELLDQSVKVEQDLILAENFHDINGSDQLCEGYTEVLGLGNGLSVIKQV
jgi:hypothetical protein